MPVPVLAVSSQIKRMSVKVVRLKKHLTWRKVCLGDLWTKGRKIPGEDESLKARKEVG